MAQTFPLQVLPQITPMQYVNNAPLLPLPMDQLFKMEEMLFNRELMRERMDMQREKHAMDMALAKMRMAGRTRGAGSGSKKDSSPTGLITGLNPFIDRQAQREQEIYSRYQEKMQNASGDEWINLQSAMSNELSDPELMAARKYQEGYFSFLEAREKDPSKYDDFFVNRMDRDFRGMTAPQDFSFGRFSDRLLTANSERELLDDIWGGASGARLKENVRLVPGTGGTQVITGITERELNEFVGANMTNYINDIAGQQELIKFRESSGYESAVERARQSIYQDRPDFDGDIDSEAERLAQENFIKNRLTSHGIGFKGDTAITFNEDLILDSKDSPSSSGDKTVSNYARTPAEATKTAVGSITPDEIFGPTDPYGIDPETGLTHYENLRDNTIKNLDIQYQEASRLRQDAANNPSNYTEKQIAEIEDSYWSTRSQYANAKEKEKLWNAIMKDAEGVVKQRRPELYNEVESYRDPQKYMQIKSEARNEVATYLGGLSREELVALEEAMNKNAKNDPARYSNLAVTAGEDIVSIADKLTKGSYHSIGFDLPSDVMWHLPGKANKKIHEFAKFNRKRDSKMEEWNTLMSTQVKDQVVQSVSINGIIFTDIKNGEAATALKKAGQALELGGSEFKWIALGRVNSENTVPNFDGNHQVYEAGDELMSNHIPSSNVSVVGVVPAPMAGGNVGLIVQREVVALDKDGNPTNKVIGKEKFIVTGNDPSTTRQLAKSVEDNINVILGPGNNYILTKEDELMLRGAKQALTYSSFEDPIVTLSTAPTPTDGSDQTIQIPARLANGEAYYELTKTNDGKYYADLIVDGEGILEKNGKGKLYGASDVEIEAELTMFDSIIRDASVREIKEQVKTYKTESVPTSPEEAERQTNQIITDNNLPVIPAGKYGTGAQERGIDPVRLDTLAPDTLEVVTSLNNVIPEFVSYITSTYRKKKRGDNFSWHHQGKAFDVSIKEQTIDGAAYPARGIDILNTLVADPSALITGNERYEVIVEGSAQMYADKYFNKDINAFYSYVKRIKDDPKASKYIRFDLNNGRDPHLHFEPLK